MARTVIGALARKLGGTGDHSVCVCLNTFRTAAAAAGALVYYKRMEAVGQSGYKTMLALVISMAAGQQPAAVTPADDGKQQQQQQQHLQRPSSASDANSGATGKGSISSIETVIAPVDCRPAAEAAAAAAARAPAANGALIGEQAGNSKPIDCDTPTTTTTHGSHTSKTNLIKLKSILLTWIPFVHADGSQASEQLAASLAGAPAPQRDPAASSSARQKPHLALIQLARSLFGGRPSSSGAQVYLDPERAGEQQVLACKLSSQSAPATPLKWRLDGPARLCVGKVRFLDRDSQDDDDDDDDSSTNNHNISSPDPGEPLADAEEGDGQSPMDSAHFRRHGYKLVDYICNYLDTIGERRVTPLNIEPGYLKQLIQADAPDKGEPFSRIMRDFESHIMCGITHWQHPHFHAYFPAGNAYPSILADMLSDALGCVGFSWAASPAYTELEIIMLDWMGKMIGLPDEFLCLSGPQNSKGGGVIQGSASECVLVSLLAARHWAIEALRKKYPNTPDGILLGKLIGYCSKEAHSCVEKAAMIGFIRMRALDTDERNSLRGDTLARAMASDIEQGLEPFIVCATLGTTSCCSFDNLQELGQVCAERQVWLHVDAAYAGSAFICPEFKYLMRGIELATSFNMNPNKWLLINFDCSLMWVKDRFKLTRAFVVDPLYLQHSFSDQAIDYRHWGIPLSRRFRSLKLWFTIRNYGVEGLQAYIRCHVRLAKLFEQLIRADARFQITNQVELGLVCFRLAGSNALNQRLLSMINGSGKLHMVPASLKGRYVIRFCVCDQRARDQDIRYAYECISAFATELFESIRAGRERIRAISQQNTIDVSSLSLHRQQSSSADRLSGGATDTVAGRQQVDPADECVNNNSSASTARQLGRALSGAKSPLTKQATVQAGSSTLDESTEPADEAAAAPRLVELDSLASIDGLDYELEEEADLLLSGCGEEAGGCKEEAGTSKAPGLGADPLAESRSPVARRAAATGGAAQPGQLAHEQEEAADEVFHLAERRNRMSLRYKREFFVRVVSDPRVYRASISGDINAHASCCSLSSQQADGQPFGPKTSGGGGGPAAAADSPTSEHTS